MITDLFNPLIEIIENIVGAVSDVIDYLSNAFETLLEVPSIFPGLWSVVPSSITDVFLSLLIISVFIGVLVFILSR